MAENPMFMEVVTGLRWGQSARYKCVCKAFVF